MNQNILKAFTPSSQRALKALARSPEDASHFFDRLTIFRAGLRIGLEVMERNMAENQRALAQVPATGGDRSPASELAQERARHLELTVASLKTACLSALGTVTALECCMSTLEMLHPELGKANVSKDPERPGENGLNRIRRLDVD